MATKISQLPSATPLGGTELVPIVQGGVTKQTPVSGFFTGTPDGSITTAKLSDNAVTTAKVADGAVTTAKIADEAVTFVKLQNISTNRLLGRSTAGTGSVEELTVGAGLTLSGGVLDTTGSGPTGNAGSDLYLTTICI